MENLAKLESDLWEAADQLRANGNVPYNEFFMPVMGIIFLRHAANRFETVDRQINEERASGKMKRAPVGADYRKRRALFLPEKARYEKILGRAKDIHIGQAVDEAMTAIEDDFAPLKGVLPKEYVKIDATLLEDLMRIFNRETLRQATGDVFGRIYEYFLMKFSMEKAHDNGEFFTPPSLVQTIVNVIEPGAAPPFDPARGIVVLDLACGSGGMFVQTSHFVETLGFDTAHRVTFYGQEKTATTIRLAKMNLAVHGLEGDIREANTYYQDEHSLVGRADFLMSNPPFNVDMIDAAKAEKDTRRLPFGLPGVNKDKKVSNGNFVWISYFWSYLNEHGRAGFVMSSQASSAGHGEKEVRRKIVETGDVDVMISIRSGFFYTRTVSCELWFFDRNKSPSPAGAGEGGRRPGEGRGENATPPTLNDKDHVLMIDARNIHRKVTRKIYDFSPEQLQNLTAIVWLYRGQTERFLDLVQRYLDRTIAEALAIKDHAAPFRLAYDALSETTASFLKTLPASPRPSDGRGARDEGATLCGLIRERDAAADDCFQSLDEWTARIARDWKKPCDAKLPAQKKRLKNLDELATACRDLIKDVDLVFKLAARVSDALEALPRPPMNGRGVARVPSLASTGDSPLPSHGRGCREATGEGRQWTDEGRGAANKLRGEGQRELDARALRKLVKDLDSQRKLLVEQLKSTAYFQRQAHWLLERFPDARFVAVPGLCRALTRADIQAADWSLTPGRYVGVAPPEVDEDFDFEQAITDIHVEVADLNQEAAALAKKIQKNFEELV